MMPSSRWLQLSYVCGSYDKVFLLGALRTRRVLVILDGLSEMVSDPSAAEQDKASPIHPDFPAAALIATSRTKDVMKGTHATIQPTRIDSEHLSRFMNAYLAKAGCPDFEDSELFRAYGRLAVMVSDGGHITPLLAKLYAEQMIASAREGKLQLDLPDTVPGLMLEYLNLLNRDKREGDPDNPSVHGVAKLAAWACLKRSFHPGPAEKKDVLDALGNTPSAPDLLESPRNGFDSFVPSRPSKLISNLNSTRSPNTWLG